MGECKSDDVTTLATLAEVQARDCREAEDYAASCCDRADFDGAEESYRKALVIRETALGPLAFAPGGLWPDAPRSACT